MKVYQFDRLSECLDYNSIDAALKGLGIEDSSQRVLVLYQHMGISQSFTSAPDVNDLSPDDEYTFAKQQLVLMNRRRMKKERKPANTHS